MKRTSTSPPYLSIAMVVRDSCTTPEKQEIFENCLKSVRARAPQCELVIVETCSRPHDDGRTVELAKRYADIFQIYRGPKGNWDETWEAVDDMRAAREYSFSLTHGRWTCWLDDDDLWLGGKESIDLLRKNSLLPGAVDEKNMIAKPTTRRGEKFEDGPQKELAGTDGFVALEDMLAWIENHDPNTTAIWCPYLYKKDEFDLALSLLWRERFIRMDNPPKWRWAEAGHECMVPIGNYIPPTTRLPWLFVHKKVWTEEEISYSFERHGKIHLAEWNAGERTFRKARYLSGYAPRLWPERQLEFLNAAFEVAFTPLDRYRARISLGAYYSTRGFSWEAKDHFAAAQAIRPDLPDAYYAAASSAIDWEDWFGAIEPLRKGIKCELPPETEIIPRKHQLEYPSRLSMVLQKCAEFLSAHEEYNNAVALLSEATDLAKKVNEDPAVDESDRWEAQTLFYRAENAWKSESTMVMLRETWAHLRANDETQKALACLSLIPHDKEQHPIAVEMETWARKIKKHLTSPKAYDEFYDKIFSGGALLYIKADQVTRATAHPRVTWIIDWIKANAPQGRVLDLGCCDGVVGLLLLKECPEISYVGVDLMPQAIDNFKKVAAEVNISDFEKRVTLEVGRAPSSKQPFDVVILGEIIEHVPDPVNWLESIRVMHLAEKGSILITTPWGAFDLGHPPKTMVNDEPRDERGHVRAYSGWAFTRDCRKAGCSVQEVSKIGMGRGDALVARVGHRRVTARPVAVAVAGSLWDWSGSTIDRDGIGASEEMIVRIGEKLTLKGERIYDVYNTTPQEEIYHSVGYFPRQAIRHIPQDTKIIISRAPAFYKKIDTWVGREQPMVLHLQDTTYRELDNEVADRYESIITVSDWHKDLTIQAHGLNEKNAAKVRRIYNWADRAHFQGGINSGWKNVKLPHHFIFASSPDRGLVHLLKLWPRILDLWPDSTLSIFYGWKGAQRLGSGANSGAWNDRFLTAKRQYEILRWQKGVTEFGMVNHYRIALEFMRASVWPYKTAFGETCCTNAIKARAGGAVPVTSALAGLNETARCPQATLIEGCNWCPETFPEGYDDLFLEGVKRAIETSTKERQEMAGKALADFSWESVEQAWKDVLA